MIQGPSEEVMAASVAEAADVAMAVVEAMATADAVPALVPGFIWLC